MIAMLRIRVLGLTIGAVTPSLIVVAVGPASARVEIDDRVIGLRSAVEWSRHFTGR